MAGNGYIAFMSKAPESLPEKNSLVKVLMDLIGKIPVSKESERSDPKIRAQAIARSASRRAATISGALALPPGPFGIATVLPDLISIWHIQRQMVADIASVYGKSAVLNREVMLYCLFKHGAAALVRDVVSRVGERLLFKKVAAAGVQQLLQKIGLRFSQRVIGQTLSRFVPVLGALGVGAYAYYDTNKVAVTAIETFSREIQLLGPPPVGSKDTALPLGGQ